MRRFMEQMVWSVGPVVSVWHDWREGGSSAAIAVECSTTVYVLQPEDWCI
ncbi:hypothetical protein GF324_12345 [bacterium]|nr:hypothetical protein [bacterium]